MCTENIKWQFENFILVFLCSTTVFYFPFMCLVTYKAGCIQYQSRVNKHHLLKIEKEKTLKYYYI